MKRIVKPTIQQEIPAIPKNQLVYGETVHWLTVISALVTMVAPVLAILIAKNNVLNPHYLFAAIWEGKGPNDIWQQVGNGFPGGHFYLHYMTTGDGLALFGLAIGCSATLWALLPTIIQYIREREYFYAGVCLFTAALIAVSMVGVSGLFMHE